MRRAALLLLFLAVPLFAAEETWYAAYDRGVEAVRTGHYDLAAGALQKAIGTMPNEGTNVRAGNTLITYVPHFWLGIAKYNLGDVDGSLREFKTSEDQGVVQTTMYYAQLRDWVARAQLQKRRNADAAAAGPKKQASDAIGRATAAQLDAGAAGGDRTEQYRAAFAKLREANEQFRGAGTDVRAYNHVSDLASTAHDLFVAAAAEAQRQKTVQVQQKPAPVVITVPLSEPEPKKEEPPPSPPPPAPAPVVESKELVDARVALQEYRRHALDAHVSDRDIPRLDAQLRGNPDAKTIARVAAEVAKREKGLQKKTAVVIAPPPPPPPAANPLESAWRAFAAGDLAGSEQQLTSLIAAAPTAEAYLLRGCARYTRGVLSGRDDAVAAAAEDFRAALKKNAALRLDPAAFSPKLIAFFEKVRGER